MKVFEFSDQHYRKPWTRAFLFVTLSLAFNVSLSYLYGFKFYHAVLMLPSFILMTIIDSHRREEYAAIIDSNLIISDQAIEYSRPRTGYKIEKKYDQIERSSYVNFLGCPIITIWFIGNEKLKLWGLENSKIAYDKVQARTDYRT